MSRVMGLLVARHLNIFMVHFIETIKIAKLPINWATILRENLDEKLVGVKDDLSFI